MITLNLADCFMVQPIKEGKERSLVTIILKELGADIKVVHPTLRIDVHIDEADLAIMCLAKEKNKLNLAACIYDTTLKVRQRDVYVRGSWIDNNIGQLLAAVDPNTVVNKIKSEDALVFKPGDLRLHLRLHPSLEVSAEFELNAPDSIDKLMDWVMARVNMYVINPYYWRVPLDAPTQSSSECSGDSL